MHLFFNPSENDKLMFKNVKNLKEGFKLENNKYAFASEDVKKIY